jgi:hypothetical protein
MRRLDCHNAIKQVKSRFQTALQTVSVLIGMVIEQPEFLYIYNLDLAEMRALAAELHDIYFTRMFACFESSLRHFWRTTIRDTKPRTEHLISSIAARLGVPQDTLDAVQEIRTFRNYLIHEEHEVQKRYTIDEASGPLNTYLARLPLE